MKNIIVVGGSKGIGYALLQSNITHSKVFNISRTVPELSMIISCTCICDVTQDPLPEIDGPIDALIYCPGSINLKPITDLAQTILNKIIKSMLLVPLNVSTISTKLKTKQPSCSGIL